MYNPLKLHTRNEKPKPAPAQGVANPASRSDAGLAGCTAKTAIAYAYRVLFVCVSGSRVSRVM